MLNADSIDKLIAFHKSNSMMLSFIKKALDSFEEYHKAVFDEQLFPVIFGNGAMDADEYREQAMALDRMPIFGWQTDTIMTVSIPRPVSALKPGFRFFMMLFNGDWVTCPMRNCWL